MSSIAYRVARKQGRTAVLGAATEVVLQISSYPAKLTILRVESKHVSGTAANFTPRIVSATGAAAGSIEEEYAGTATAVASKLDSKSVDTPCETDALGRLYMVFAPDAGADNVFDYVVYYQVNE